MSDPWREITIGDLVDQGFAEVRTGPFGTQLRASDYSDRDDGVPVLNVRNLGYGTLRQARVERVGVEVQERLSGHLLREGDIVFGRKGAVDRHVLVTSRQSGWMQGSDCIRLRILFGSPISPEFLSKALLTEEHKAWMEGQGSHGATMSSLNQDIIRRIRLRAPDARTQARIAAALSCFNELIEINERRIELLEGLARSLYRQWFVQFRFPGHEHAEFIDSELGQIPVDWAVTPASEAFAIGPRISGDQSTYRKVVMADVSERVSHVLPSDIVDRPSGSRFMRGDVLLARITPCLENGKTALVLFLEPNEVGVGSTEFLVLRGLNVGPAFTYCAARSDQVREHAIKSMSGASGRQRVAKDCFDSLPMIEPSRTIASMFEGMAGPMLEATFQYRVQSDELAATRDLLLPRLVTGRLDISDIDLGVLIPAEEE